MLADQQDRIGTDGQGQSIKIAIVDDSMVLRAILKKLISNHQGYEVTGDFASARQLINYLGSERVDIIILDIEMPERSGLDALPDVLHKCADARVLVLSSLCTRGAPSVVRALSLGACDTLAKPNGHSYTAAFSETLLRKMQILSRRKVHQPDARVHHLPPLVQRNLRFDCLAIGSSTGGINALQLFLRNLHKTIHIPILITQHLPPVFIPSLASQLEAFTHYRVKVAELGERILPGTIYIAPGEAHLMCRRTSQGVIVDLHPQWEGTIYRPSADPMITTMADCYGEDCAALMFSGMGKDGLEGSRYLAKIGGKIIAQNAESSVVWGMPGAVAREGLVWYIESPEKIANFLSAKFAGSTA